MLDKVTFDEQENVLKGIVKQTFIHIYKVLMALFTKYSFNFAQ